MTFSNFSKSSFDSWSEPGCQAASFTLKRLFLCKCNLLDLGPRFWLSLVLGLACSLSGGIEASLGAQSPH